LSALTRRLVLPLAAAGLAACAGIAAAALSQGPGVPLLQDRDEKVTICHATASDTNPFVQEQPDHDSIVKESGHDSHPDDIIPPFSYVDGDVTKHYPGKNWDGQGQAIWGNGCNVPPPAPPLPKPVQPTVKCVDDNGSTFTAVFGYVNPNETAVTASDSSFSPSDRGQPATFNPGTVESAFTTTGKEGETLAWSVTVGGVTTNATATASFTPRCSTEPPPKPAIEISVKCVDNTGGTFSATFAYASSATSAVTIDPGPSNSLSPPLASPPSSFQPGGGEFTVSGIPNATSLTWTLTTDETRTATATSELAKKCTPPPAPRPILVSVACIQNRGATFDATFGYVNPNGSPVDISSGPENQVTVRIARSATQPTTFQPGTSTNAFTVTNVPSGADAEWRVTYAGATSVATANKAFPTHCGVDPPDPPDAYRVGIFVSCVTDEGSTYSATFGYSSEDTETNDIPIGEKNRFFPGPEGRGQPTTFEPGINDRAFTVTGIPAGTPLVWRLTSDEERSAEATANFEPKCNPEPPPAELVPIGLFVNCVINHADTYDAVYGYTNDNRAEQIVPLGLENTFLSAPGNRGQPTTFEPGTVRNAVTVTGIPNGAQLTWVVRLGNIRAAAASQFVERKCDEPPQPPTPPPPDPKPPESGLFATCVLRIDLPRTYDAVFGYANASGANAFIPVGRRNLVTPGPVNRGQPSLFRPGIVLNAFTVKNIPRSRNVTWSVRIPNGEIRTTTATAQYPRNCITAPTPPGADLVLTKTVNPAHLNAGQRGTYRIHVLNRGPNIALRVRVTDLVDPRLELLSASTTRGSCTTSRQRVTCTIRALPPGAPVVIVVAVRALGAGTIRNTAVGVHSRPDPTPGNNVSSAVITVTGSIGGVAPAFTG